MHLLIVSRFIALKFVTQNHLYIFKINCDGIKYLPHELKPLILLLNLEQFFIIFLSKFNCSSMIMLQENSQWTNKDKQLKEIVKGGLYLKKFFWFHISDVIHFKL